MTKIEDVSPNWSNTTITHSFQSVQGRMLSLACSSDGQRVYSGTYSGVWRSDDEGQNFRQLVRPQPPPDQFGAPGALGGWEVFDLAVSPTDRELLVAVTRYDLRKPGLHGIYRSIDGGDSWTMVHQFPGLPDSAGQIVWAPDDDNFIVAAWGTSVAISRDAGVTFTDVFPWGNPGDGVAYHVAMGPLISGTRLVYALGNNRVWYSPDIGHTWFADPLPVPSNAGGPDSEGLGNAPCVMVTLPQHSGQIYVLADDGTLWLRSYAAVTQEWVPVPTPNLFNGEVDSGNNFLAIGGSIANPLVFYCAKTRLYVAPAPPGSANDWRRLDEDHRVHPDLHGVFLSPGFHAAIDSNGYHVYAGTLWLLSDGGLYRSTDGGRSFAAASGLSTLATVNIGGVAIRGQTALCLNTGDNAGFYSLDSGQSWKTLEYLGGDNDCSFADPLQPDRLLNFTPRRSPSGSVTVYVGLGFLPDGTGGTGYRYVVDGPPGPTPRTGFEGAGMDSWNAVSPHVLRGYRPIVHSLWGEEAPDAGDYIFIRYKTDSTAMLLRTVASDQIEEGAEFDTDAITPEDGVNVFQQGPALPSPEIDVVQASGGHSTPVFYCGGDSGLGLWKWTKGMAGWRQLVPGPGMPVSPYPGWEPFKTYDMSSLIEVVVLGTPYVFHAIQGGTTTFFMPVFPATFYAQVSDNGIIWENVGVAGPFIARRFFLDPYRPEIVFIVDADHIKRSDDGGLTWVVDANLERQLTNSGELPLDPNTGGKHYYLDNVLNDMKFDPQDARKRFAVGAAGVFFTVDGENWHRLLDSTALPGRPGSCYYDFVSDPCRRALYVGLVPRGVVKLSPLPWGSLQAPDPETWTVNTQIPGKRSRTRPALAVHQGLLFMVHQDESSNDMWWSTSSDALHWTDDQKIPNQKTRTVPALVEFNNVLYLVHLGSSGNDIFWSMFDGTTWKNSQGVEGDEQIGAMLSEGTPSLAVYQNALHMVHMDDSSHEIWWSIFDGTSWKDSDGNAGDQKIKAQRSQSPPALAVFGGKLHMVHIGDDTNDVWWSAYDGEVWWSNRRIRCQRSQQTPALAEHNGLLHMVHMGDDDNSLWWSIYDGSEWTPNLPFQGKRSKDTPALSPSPDGSSLVMVHLGDDQNDMWQSSVPG